MLATTANPNLQASTHNGKLPNEGGLPKPKLPLFADINTCVRTVWDECPNCDRGISLWGYVRIATANCGDVRLLKCLCGQLIRTYGG